MTGLENLPPDARESLRRAYEGSETARCARWVPERVKDSIQDRWCEEALQIEVEVRPGGRSILRRAGVTYSVELQWSAKGRYIRLSRAQVIEDDRAWGLETYGAPDVAQYVAALHHHLRTTGKPIPGPVPGARPARGRPKETGFYSRLLREYKALLNARDAAPTRTLADRYGVSRDVVKTWLKRGRKYLGEEGGD